MITETQNSAVVMNPLGLHARPAVKLSKMAKTFDSDVKILGAGKQVWVNAKSTSALMKMRVPMGSEVQIRAIGLDALAAVEAIVALIEQRFGET